MDDSSWSMRPSRVQSSNKLSRGIYGVRHVSFVDWLVSQIEASLRLPCTPSIKTNILPLISLRSQKIHCQSESVTCQRSVRSTPSSQNLIRSLFSSVSDYIHSICFYLSFYSPLGKNLSFLHPSPFFQTRQS